MPLQIGYSASEDTFPLPQDVRERYGPFGFPEPQDAARPYITSNFVMGIDGKASFRELERHEGSKEVSRSREDRWLMDFLRAHHDAHLIGANTLRKETGPDGLGWDYAVADEPLRAYRRETLRLGRQKIIVLTGSGNIDANFRVFNSLLVEPWILTTAEGEKRFRSRLNMSGRNGMIKIVSTGPGKEVNLTEAVKTLRQEHGIRTLLCEGGPTLYGELLKRKLVDEDFRTLSLQVMGESTKPGISRPTSYGDVRYTPETAPWFKLISLHYALPYHAFFRLRYVGPRKF
jgi:riboflavin biosynthesis pyrimidine reductase